jgi:hypothetical protein
LYLPDLLIHCAGIFTPGKHLSAEVQAAAMELLARSTCCSDDGQDKEGDADRMEETHKALQAALELGQRAQGKITPEDARFVDLVRRACQQPLPCAHPMTFWNNSAFCTSVHGENFLSCLPSSRSLRCLLPASALSTS